MHNSNNNLNIFLDIYLKCQDKTNVSSYLDQDYVTILRR